MSFVEWLEKSSKRYFRDRHGNFAVTTAFIGLPLLFVAGYAIDYNSAYSYKNGIKSALDAATLAAVVPQNLSDPQRLAFAQKVFDENYFGDIAVKLDVNAEPGRIDIAATGAVPTLFGGIVGKDTISVRETSAAILTSSDVVCALALDPTGDRAIEFTGDARFNSPECSVQANSTSSRAMVSDSSYTPNAKSFCTAGVSTGRFSPFVKHACTPIADPYANLTLSTSSKASYYASFCHDLETILSINQMVQDFGNGEIGIGNNAVLPPGNYCDGMRLAGLNITFMPGVYNISGGNLHFEDFSSAQGDGVTFVLDGENTSLLIESGAEASFTAPSQGDYAGLVFYQKPAAGSSSASYPDGKSMIGSGGSLNITGTAYFPTQQLIITSDNPVASKAPATSFIAYRLIFAGQSYTEIHVDHEEGGIPPLLPRSDEGARLVSYEEPTNGCPTGMFRDSEGECDN